MLIFKLALRNLRQHLSKTLILGIIVAVGVMILVVGNSLISTVSKGIRQTFSNNFTGDVVIGGIPPTGDLSLFGVISFGELTDTPVLPDYEKIKARLEKDKARIEIWTPQITGFAAVRQEGQKYPDNRIPTFLFGIEPESYRTMFDKIELVEGAYLKPGESGLMTSMSNREALNEHLGTDLQVGDKLVITGLSTEGIKIREVEVKGFYRYLRAVDGVDVSSYIDLENIRALKSMNLGGALEISLADNQTDLLEADDLDSFFSEDSDFDSGEISDGGYTLTEEDLDNLLDLPADQEVQETSTTMEEDYSRTFEFILVRLKPFTSPGPYIRRLNRWFREQGIPAQAMGWKKAAGPFAKAADIIQVVFNAAVFLVALVAVIIMINTLVLSVLERTGEIGTIRALGGQKPFVRQLFNTEVFLITVIFGIAGILLGLLAIGIINLWHIEANNLFVQIIFAGKVLRPVVRAQTLLIPLGAVIILGMLSNIYPVRLALKVQPVTAMGTE